MRQQVLPQYTRSHARAYNDYYDFVFAEDHNDTSSWKLDDRSHVLIDTTCTTDPKEGDPHRWTVRFKGRWDITAGRLVVEDFHVTSPLSQQDIVKKLIGEWDNAVHIRAFYADGTFALDPEPAEKPTGTWKLRKDQLITQSADDQSPAIERIVKITDSEMVSINEGVSYTYWRVVH